MSENKIRYGLSNVHIGTVTLGEVGSDPTFGVPKSYEGAVSLKLDAEGEQSVFYADNVAYYVSNSNNGYSGELEMATLPDWLLTEFLGHVKSKEGDVVEISDSKEVAAYIMFQFEGDQSATKHIIYNSTFGRPSIEGNTKEDATDPSTTTIPFKAIPLQTKFGKIIKAKVPSTSSKYENFFKSAPTVPTANAGV